MEDEMLDMVMEDRLSGGMADEPNDEPLEDEGHDDDADDDGEFFRDSILERQELEDFERSDEYYGYYGDE